ncbi:hypothetical protein Bca4012_038059 [Brassica carinata]|uniref:Uncharacterized protein n=1 Tax=Brassica carinata TaxID=52824 RepID=A0A8X7W635_BRACI|nr:hypothetical protein Bca52824_006507 [Brassica carinata]
MAPDSTLNPTLQTKTSPETKQIPGATPHKRNSDKQKTQREHRESNRLSTSYHQICLLYKDSINAQRLKGHKLHTNLGVVTNRRDIGSSLTANLQWLWHRNEHNTTTEQKPTSPPPSESPTEPKQ